MKSLAATLVLPLALTACPGGGGSPGELSITDSAGVIEMLDEDGTWIEASTSLSAGSELQLSGEDAFVSLEGAVGAVRVAVARGATEARMAVTEDGFKLRYGDLAVASMDDAAVSIEVPNASDSVSELIAETTGGTMRVSIGDSKRLAVYDGVAMLTFLGESVEVGSWRQVGFASGRLPGLIPPLRLDPNDPMDLFAASEIVSLDRELASVARGFEAEFGLRIRSISELSDIAADAARAPFTFLQPLLRAWRAGDVLIGLVLALVHESTAEVSLPDAFGEVKQLREAGASWGIAAAILGLTPTTVTDRVARAVALRAGEIDPGRGDPINTPPTDQPTSNPTPSPTPRPSGSKSPSPKPSGTRSPSPSGSSSSPSPPPTTTEPPIPPPTTPSPPPPTSSCQPVDQIFGNC